MSDSILDLVSSVDGFMEIHELFDDPDVDEAMGLVIKLIAKPDIAAQKVPPVIVKLQALSSKFRIQAIYYTTLGKAAPGTPNHYRKNILYTMSDTLDKLVSSLKYLQRGGYQ